MKRRILFHVGLGLILATTAAAQHGQGHGQQGQGQRPPTAGSQGSTGSAGGSQTQMRDQQRLKIQATDQQQQQLKTCSQSVERLRSRVRQMSRISSSQKIAAEQAKQWREQLRAEMEAMNQEQERLVSGLTTEQKSAVQTQTKEMETSRTRLDDMAEAVEMELALEEPDPAKVQQTAKQMETEVNRIRTQQKKLENELIQD
jgi:hypothetical protein